MRQASQSPLTSLRLHSGGAEVAAGSADGSVTIMRLSASLTEVQPNEKATVTGVSWLRKAYFRGLIWPTGGLPSAAEFRPYHVF